MKHARALITLAILGLALTGAAQAEMTLLGAKSGLPAPMITTLAATEGWLWVGTSKGLVVRAPGETRFTTVPGLTGRITALAAVGERAWVVSAEGVVLAKGTSETPVSLGLPFGVSASQVKVLQTAENGAVWMGTEQGLFVQPSPESGWNGIGLPSGIEGPVHSLTCSGSLVYLGAGLSHLLVYDSVSGRWLCQIECKEKTSITAISVYGTKILAGTNGQGLLAYDWAKNTWLTVYPDQPVNSFFQTGMDNGSEVWFGTFESLVQVDQETNRVSEIKLDLPEGAVTALAMSSQELFIGTEFGLGIMPLDRPRLTLAPQGNVLLKPSPEVTFQGLAFSPHGISQVKAAFSVRSLPEIWFEGNLNLDPPDAQGHFSGRWKTDDLPSPNDFYLIRVRVTDKLGRSNTTIAPLLVATAPPVLSFNPVKGPMNVGLQTFSGKFNTPFMNMVTLDPGGIETKSDPLAGTFSGTVSLRGGENTLRATLVDWFDRRGSAEYPVQGIETALEQAVVVQPGAKKGEERIVLSEALLFDMASVDVKTSGLVALDKVVDYMQRDSAIQGLIVGHTDNWPIKNDRFPSNQVLSEERARSVFDYIVKVKKIVPERFSIEGRGDKEPIADNETEGGRTRNRRVEIILKKVE